MTAPLIPAGGWPTQGGEFQVLPDGSVVSLPVPVAAPVPASPAPEE